MILNHLKIAFRQLRKQRFYTLINLVGLALSVAACLLIALYVRHEVGYDHYHQHADHLYRVALDINLNQSVAKGAVLPPPVAKTLVADLPEVINAARMNQFFANAGTNLMRLEQEEQSSFQEKFVYVDQAFTEMFDLTHIAGDANTWLTEPYSILITEKIARTFFPDSDPVGQAVILNEDVENQRYLITGVVGDPPANTHLDYHFFMSMSTLDDSEDDNWVYNNYATYVQLSPGTDPAALTDKLAAFGMRYFAPQFQERMNINLAEAIAGGAKYGLFFQPVKDIHLHSEGFIPQGQDLGDIRYVQLFSLIGLFLLLIAIFNFVNISTARSANRAREVGVRKVMGSSQSQLVFQFLAESILICMLAFAGGLLLAELLLDYFNVLAGRSLFIPYSDGWFLPTLISMAVFIGMVAGIYPSLYLSRFKPHKVLKGSLSLGSKSAWLRKGLVIFQFGISSTLIIGTFVVYSQMRYIQQKKIGFEKDQVLLIQDTYTLGTQVPAFKSALQQLPSVESVSIGSYLPLDGGFRNSMMYHAESKTDPSDQIPIQFWPVDTDYLPTLGIQLKQGRNFGADRPTDSLAVILNQTAVRQLGIVDPIDKRIKSPFDDAYYTIIGVVEDFNFESLKHKIQGLGMVLGNNTSTIAVKGNSGQLDQLIASTKATWHQFAPNQSFRYSFLDDRFDQMYVSEQRAATLFNLFAGLAIIIACLGLFALATFMTEQRTKEIGIRKVLGASVSGLVGLVSKDFLILVLWAFVIAVPVALLLMNRWLQNFVYHTDIPWWAFVLAGLATLLIAFLTVSFQSIKAALINPVESLRAE